jgi:succinoglycan biosynthesis transport protein ExoP
MIREAADVDGERSNLDINLVGLFALLRRERRKAIRIVAATVTLALAYSIFAPRTYLSTADILVATRPKDILAAAAPDASSLSGLVDPGLIESQVEILKSSSVLLAVTRKLDLLNDDLFMGRNRWSPLLALRDAVASLFRSQTDGDGKRFAEQWAVKTISDRLKVKRVGMTYVVDVQYTGLSPDLAFRIVSALSDEYIDGELRARYDNSRRATEWFRQRLLDLEKDVAAADHEVQRYRAANNIVDTSHGRLDEQQLDDMSAQLAAAEAATADAKARYERVASAAKTDPASADFVGSVSSEALKSEAIAKLREQYART